MYSQDTVSSYLHKKPGVRLVKGGGWLEKQLRSMSSLHTHVFVCGHRHTENFGQRWNLDINLPTFISDNINNPQLCSLLMSILDMAERSFWACGACLVISLVLTLELPGNHECFRSWLKSRTTLSLSERSCSTAGQKRRSTNSVSFWKCFTTHIFQRAWLHLHDYSCPFFQSFAEGNSTEKRRMGYTVPEFFSTCFTWSLVRNEFLP